jgi:hypothetical protein
LKQQASWAIKGMKGTNEMIVYVEEYFNKKILRKLGYSFDPNELSSGDVEAFNIIESVISKYESDQMKKLKTKGRRNGR